MSYTCLTCNNPGLQQLIPSGELSTSSGVPFKALLVCGRELRRMDLGHMNPWPTYPVDEHPLFPVSHHMSLQCAQAWASIRKPQDIVQGKRVFRGQKGGGLDLMLPFRRSLPIRVLPSFSKNGIHRILRDPHRLYHWNGRCAKKLTLMCLEGSLYRLRMWNCSPQHVLIELRKSLVVGSNKEGWEFTYDSKEGSIAGTLWWNYRFYASGQVQLWSNLQTRSPPPLLLEGVVDTPGRQPGNRTHA